MALLRVGLAVPVLLPVPRWALTPPFHHYRADPKANLRRDGQSLLCGAFPGVTPAGRYPAPLPTGVRTFLEGLPPRGHPALRARRQLGVAARVASTANRRKTRRKRAIGGIQRPRGPGPEAQAEGRQQRSPARRRDSQRPAGRPGSRHVRCAPSPRGGGWGGGHPPGPARPTAPAGPAAASRTARPGRPCGPAPCRNVPITACGGKRHARSRIPASSRSSAAICGSGKGSAPGVRQFDPDGA